MSSSAAFGTPAQTPLPSWRSSSEPTPATSTRSRRVTQLPRTSSSYAARYGLGEAPSCAPAAASPSAENTTSQTSARHSGVPFQAILIARASCRDRLQRVGPERRHEGGGDQRVLGRGQLRVGVEDRPRPHPRALEQLD